MDKLELKGKVIVLRRMLPQDAPTLYTYRSLPEVSRYQDWLPEQEEDAHALAREQAELEAGRPGSWLQLIICRRDDGEMVGDCGILFPDAESATPELGIALSPDHRGRGYATVATWLMLDHLFSEMGAHRVVARTDPRNLPSIAVLNRLGLREEAHHRRSHRCRGEWVDELVFAILAEEWERERGGAR